MPAGRPARVHSRRRRLNEQCPKYSRGHGCTNPRVDTDVSAMRLREIGNDADRRLPALLRVCELQGADVSLRTYLARTGLKKGNLSGFVASDEVEDAIEQALTEVRAECSDQSQRRPGPNSGCVAWRSIRPHYVPRPTARTRSGCAPTPIVQIPRPCEGRAVHQRSSRAGGSARSSAARGS